jgi:hypothetical protein
MPLLDLDGRADGTEADVGPDDLGVGNLGLDIRRDARVLRAVTAGGAGSALLLWWVGRVEPEHVGVVLSYTIRFMSYQGSLW